MSDFAPTRNDYTGSDRRWARNFLALDTHDITLDGSAFPAGVLVPSGTHIGEITATNLGGPYSNGATDGRQKSVGILVNDYMPRAGRRALVAVVSGGGPVDRRYLPAGHDAAAEADLTAVNFIN